MRRRAVDRRTGRLYRLIGGSWKLSAPPPVLRWAILDNLVLVPGSLLPFKKEWQQLANEFPRGTILIILPTRDSRPRQMLKKMSEGMAAQGQRVAVVPADQLPHSRHDVLVQSTPNPLHSKPGRGT